MTHIKDVPIQKIVKSLQ